MHLGIRPKALKRRIPLKYIYKKSKKFPYIHKYLVIQEEDLIRPVKWPDVPFVYQYFVFMNYRPLPPNIHTKNWQIDNFDTVFYPDGTTEALWEQDLIYYDKNQNPLFVESLMKFGSNWSQLIAERVVGIK